MDVKFTRSFTLTEIEAEIISEKAREMGDSSGSAAFRAICREWKRLTDQNDGRFSRPDPNITIADAMKAAEATK